MLEAIKRLLERTTRRAEGDAIAGWARRAGHVYKREKDGDGFAIDGQFDAKPWRLEWGTPQRPYIDGHELRMRMVLGIPPDLQMLLMTKPLRERLAKDAFEQATQTNQTALDDTIGEETRWLVVFPKISLAGSQILRNCFAGVSSLPHEGQAWLEGPLSHGLERHRGDEPDAAGVQYDVGDGLAVGDARDSGGDLVACTQFHAGQPRRAPRAAVKRCRRARPDPGSARRSVA